MKIIVILILSFFLGFNVYPSDSEAVTKAVKDKLKWIVADSAPGEVRGIVYTAFEVILDKISNRLLSGDKCRKSDKMPGKEF